MVVSAVSNDGSAASRSVSPPFSETWGRNSHRPLSSLLVVELSSGFGMDRREGRESVKLGKEGEEAEAYSLWAQETSNFPSFDLITTFQ